MMMKEKERAMDLSVPSFIHMENYLLSFDYIAKFS